MFLIDVSHKQSPDARLVRGVYRGVGSEPTILVRLQDVAK